MNDVVIGLVAAAAAAGVVYATLTFGVGVDFAAQRVKPVVVEAEPVATDEPTCAELLAYSREEVDYLRTQRAGTEDLIRAIIATEAEVTPESAP
jgi:hypothetical protein